MGYLFLLLTIVSESLAVIFMKMSDGFQHRWHAGIAIVAYLSSFLFLTFALKHLPAGWTNAIWAGASAVIVAVLSMFIFKETLRPLQLVSLALIVIGLIGLQAGK